MHRDELPIETPCGNDWSGMKPADMKKRFCDACKMHVHDLASMTEREAGALLASEATSGLCIRYLYDAHGKVVFSDDARLVAPNALVRAKRFALGAMAVALPMTLTACMGAAPVPRQIPTVTPAATAPTPAPTTSAMPVASDAGAPLAK